MSQLLDGLHAFADNRDALSKMPLDASAQIAWVEIWDRLQTKN